MLPKYACTLFSVQDDGAWVKEISDVLGALPEPSGFPKVVERGCWLLEERKWPGGVRKGWVRSQAMPNTTIFVTLAELLHHSEAVVKTMITIVAASTY